MEPLVTGMVIFTGIVYLLSASILVTIIYPE